MVQKESEKIESYAKTKHFELPDSIKEDDDFKKSQYEQDQDKKEREPSQELQNPRPTKLNSLNQISEEDLMDSYPSKSNNEDLPPQSK